MKVGKSRYQWQCMLVDILHKQDYYQEQAGVPDVAFIRLEKVKSAFMRDDYSKIVIDELFSVYNEYIIPARNRRRRINRF